MSQASVLETGLGVPLKLVLKPNKILHKIPKNLHLRRAHKGLGKKMT